jgi:phospho-N-acetylmuramoyl-pentapeptide-transferase
MKKRDANNGWAYHHYRHADSCIITDQTQQHYIILLIVTTLWMGTIGFIDDYIKIFKKDKQGLKGIFKVIGQVGLGVIVGSVLYLHPGVTIRNEKLKTIEINRTENVISQAAPK